MQGSQADRGEAKQSKKLTLLAKVSSQYFPENTATVFTSFSNTTSSLQAQFLSHFLFSHSITERTALVRQPICL